MEDLISWEDLGTSSPNTSVVFIEETDRCPLCFNNFPRDDIEKHVNNCLNESEKAADPFAVVHDFEEEERIRKRQQEDENERLLLQFLEEEKKREQQRKEEASNSFHCESCGKEFVDLSKLYFLDSCGHSHCRDCLTKFINKKIDEIKCSEIVCQKPGCSKPFTVVDIKELTSKEEFEKYEKTTFLEVVNSKNSSFVRCPNKDCTFIIERVSGKPSVDSSPAETGPNGQPLSKEAIIHKNENRFRCRECQTEFCASCASVPYHLGFTCDQFAVYQKAKHCRFCNSQLTKDNTAPNKENHKALEAVCNSPDCIEKRNIACTKMLSCGHPCCGIRNEKKCPPCLHEDCSKNADISQNHEDYCNICWVEDLGSAPSIFLDCGHFFHHNCVKKKIANKWAGSRITFGFLECALCKKRMSHPALVEDLKPILKLYDEVKAKATERLKLLNLAKCDDITKKDSKFFNDPSGYAMYRFSYFPCYKCKKPYFGGEKVCDGNNQEEFDPKELVCGSCSDFAALENCPTHGKDFVEYKCKFCCNVSVWFCWGTTHFCDDCHKKAGTIPNVPKNQLPPCTCSVKHPPNGEEFLLGCSLCRIQKFNCF